MVHARTLCLAAFGLSLCLAQPLPLHAQSEAEIDAARNKGIEYIKSRQEKDGNWKFDGHEVGITSLCTVALIENGVSHNDPIVRKAYEYVLKNTASITSTYDIALAITLLYRMGDRRDRLKIKELVARLVAGQLKTGGWTYTCPVAELDVLRNPQNAVLKDGTGDNSCTQFAVLGLWVASRTGVNIDYTLGKVAQRFVQNQKPDGGWDYALDAKAGSSYTMTSAGIFCLAVAQANRIRGSKPGTSEPAATPSATPAATTDKPAEGTKPEPSGKSLMQNPVFSKGLTKTGEFVKGIGPGTAAYFLWSVERVGVILGLEKLGTTDWYQAGSNALLKTQKMNGSWDLGHKELADTSFALLFLRKANLGSDISRLLEGETSQKFQIVNRDDKPRFDSLEEALLDAKPGDTVRIDGNGPWALKHLELKQDITLQAGFGYTPVFNFEIGVNRLGIKLRPETDAAARSMIRVTGGKVTLEGLHLQMDPPKAKNAVRWAGVTVTGGSLRLLNCKVSEGNKQGFAAAVLAAPGQLVVRNCLFSGGRAGVEVVAQGKQEVILQNSVIYSDGGVIAVPDAKKAPADISVNLFQSTIQARNAFGAAGLTGNLKIHSDRSVYRADSLGLTLLASASSAAGRTFTGTKNLYDVKDWVGAAGKKSPAVTDLKSWVKFMGNKEQGSFKAAAAFVSLRQTGGYTHKVNAQDWQMELAETADPDLLAANVGIDSFIVGTGREFDAYRETPEYFRGWMRGNVSWETEVAQAP